MKTTGEKSVWTPDLLDAPHDVPDKARRVRHMFNGIAARYELVNRLFSGGRDAAWRREAVRIAGVGADDDVLDIACGTGDFARTSSAVGARLVVGTDFAHEMLVRATGRSGDRSVWCEADALRLPFRAGSFSVTSCAFGVRNFADLEAAYAEMVRVLRPGGRAVVLEFGRPRNRVARGFYEFYSNRVMPLAATLVSGDKTGAYRYLPRSVVSFLDADQMEAAMLRAGFSRVVATPLTMGVVTVFIATRD